MKKMNVYRIILLTLLSMTTLVSFSWDHSIELGYGISHDPNHSSYKNSGFLLTSDVLPLRRTSMTFWTLNAALGQWHTTAPVNKNLTTAALALALRFYPGLEIDYPAYFLASVGPAYLSSKRFGNNKQGSNLAFQINGGLGVEFNNIDVNLRLTHYSNAYLARPNNGYNILYILSIGYLF